MLITYMVSNVYLKKKENNYNIISFKIIKLKAIHFLDNESESIFRGLSEKGIFIWRKRNNCNKLLKLLPESWNRISEYN